MKRRSAFSPANLLPALLLPVLLLSGCQSLQDRWSDEPEPVDPDAYEKLASQVLKGKAVKPAEAYQSDTIVVDEVAPEEATAVENRDFPQSRLPADPAVPIAAYPEGLIKGIKDPAAKVRVELTMDEMAVHEIVPAFADLLSFSYQIDPAVKGSVTMHVDSEMTAKEAWELFEHILWLSGAYASHYPGFIHVLPFSKMPYDRRLLGKHQAQANVEVAFIPVYHVTSAEIIKNLQPFMTEGATVTDLTAQNTLLIVEAPANMLKLRELVLRLDSRGEAKWPHACIQVREVDAEELLNELEELLPVLGYPIAGSGPSGGKVKLTVLPRLSTIVVSAALPEVLKEVTVWVEALDRADSTSKEDIFFYEVQHSTAEKLDEMLSVFFNADSTTSAKATSRTKSTSAKTTATASSRTTANNRSKATTSKPKKRTKSNDELTDSIFDTPVVVYVDQEHNRLTLKTTRRAFSLIQAMLERHDIAPRQVLVEAKIVEVTLGKNTEYGFAYALEHSDLQGSVSHMGTDAGGNARSAWDDTGTAWTGKDPVTGLYPSNTSNFTSGAGGLAIGYLKGDTMAFLNAVAGEGKSKVLSYPQVVATNGVEGEINIGRKVAIKTTEYNDDYKSSYEYQDTGTKLTATPYITAGNDVRLEIQQVVSSVIEGTGGDGSPDISNKTLTTTLIIPDGGTAIMGGLIDVSSSEGHTGIPILKDIPLLGRLFRTNDSSSTRNELLVLISVNVLDVQTDTVPLLKRYHKALQAIQEQMD